MNDRIKLLAGLIDEDDFHNVRESVSDEYDNIVNEDVKEYSENFEVLTEDEDRLNRMLSIEEEVEEWEGKKVLNESQDLGGAAMGGYGPGFGDRPNTYNPFESKMKTMVHKWSLNEKEQMDLPGEIEDKNDDFISMDMMNALEALSNGGDEMLRHNRELQQELVQQGLIEKISGSWALSGEGRKALGLQEAWEGRRMGPGSHHTEYREDYYDTEDVPVMHTKHPQQPNGWSFYENDPTYRKIEAQAQDPLDFEELNDEAEKFNYFVSQYDLNKDDEYE